MNLSDYHIHSYFSGDSTESLDNIAEFAISSGLSEICITDHQDFDFMADGILYEINPVAYSDIIDELSYKYRNKIKIKKGIETGLEPDKNHRLDDFINSADFDFVIGSSHLVNGKDPYYPDFFNNKTDDQAFMEYFESILNNLETCSNFDVYGHIDYVVRYSPNKDKNYSYIKYKDILDNILKKIINMGKGIEINTSGYKSGLKEPNPCFEIIKRYRELGGEIITAGSDAHQCNYIGYRFKDAASILKNAGFRYYTKFNKRKPEFIKLD